MLIGIQLVVLITKQFMQKLLVVEHGIFGGTLAGVVDGMTGAVMALYN